MSDIMKNALEKYNDFNNICMLVIYFDRNKMILANFAS